MYKIFDRENGTYTMPNGKTYTSTELKNSGEYNLLFEKVCVVDVVDGIFQTYFPLAQYAANYGIEYSSDSSDSPESVIEKVEQKKKFYKENPVMTINDVVRKAASFAALSFTDEQAVQVPDLYPEYEVDHAYKKDERFTYNGHLFKVNQAHTSAAQWVPGETGTESLYTNLEMAGDSYLVWTQPTGAHNAYNTGDIVHYPTADDPLYKSLIDGNSWSPDAYPQGWKKYDASTSTEPSTPDPGTETPTEPSETDYPDFVQPTGAHDAYKKGDIVRYNGKLYQSLIDANAYSPDAYPQGWKKYSEE